MYPKKRGPLLALAGMLVLLLCLTAGAAELTEFDQLNGKTVSMLTGAPFADLVQSKAPEVKEFTYFNNTPDMLLTRAAKTQAQDTGDGLAAYRTATVAVLTGTIFGELVKARLPETRIEYFNSQADMVAALKAGKVDAIALDEPVGRYMTSQEDDLELAPERLDSQLYAFALSKQNAALEEELSRFIREKKADGTLKALQEKWLDAKNQSSQQLSDCLDLPAVNGTLRMAVFSMPPFTIQEGDLFGGYEVELAAQFCRERGYGLEFMGINADGILASIQSGKCDLGGCGITITEERKESILFSEPDYEGGTVLVVAKQKAAAEEKKDFFASIRDSFERTFIREDRWQLFLQGVATTLFITILSILLGTALGFGVFLLCRKGDPVANGITRFCVWLVQGMPMVVLLMILYYVVFGKLDIPGTAVSVMAFTLVFGAAVFGMLRQGVDTVDRGQTEAAYALGYTDNQTFFRVVLPQALPHVLPFYRGEVVSTIKATAIVGYVAVMDLTKMGDLVRSRTYEAFFPLIAVAVIYFLLEALLTAVVDRLAQGVDPKSRSKEEILKGVTVK